MLHNIITYILAFVLFTLLGMFYIVARVIFPRSFTPPEDDAKEY